MCDFCKGIKRISYGEEIESTEKDFARELENVATDGCEFTAPEVETKKGEKIELIDGTAE